MPSWTRYASLWIGAVLVSPVALAQEFIVSHPGDSGPGSLAHAIDLANQQPGEDTIRFVSDLFKEPHTLILRHPLPDITDPLIIDGYIPERLWRPTGITLDAGKHFNLIRLKPDIDLTLRYLTLSNGKADKGGAIFSEGNLVLDSLLLMNNQATLGGAIFQQGGSLTLINSTLLDNHASEQGGALYSDQGKLTLTHNTIIANQAPQAAGLFRHGALQLSNNIVANNVPGKDAVCRSPTEPDSHANLIMQSDGCGTPRFQEDPRLDMLGYYNGPTRSLPLRGNSPVINQADNALSVDEKGEALEWDQRGNGDPRFAAGIADMGAFEKQAVIQLQVDTLSDDDLRRCTSLSEDCSLRGALALLNASKQLSTLTLDPQVFNGETTLQLLKPLPRVQRDATLHLKPGQSLRVNGHGGIQTREGVRFTIQPPP